MTVTAESFKTVYPEFSTETDERVTLFIGKAQTLAGNATKWGALYDEAVEALTAHRLARSNEAASSENGKSAGPKTRLDVENQYSETYASPTQGKSSKSAEDAEYSQTVYGQQYLAVKRRVIGAYQVGVV